MFCFRGYPPLLDIDDDAKRDIFEQFKGEAKEAFTKYRVLYLRGTKVPSCYDELLPCSKTTYKDIHWEGIKPPPSNTFSVKDLSASEQEALNDTITAKVKGIMELYISRYGSTLNRITGGSPPTGSVLFHTGQ